MAAVSPSSSPRLPSPPPIAEDQIGPTSPGIPLFEDQNQLQGLNNLDTGASRRIRPGTKSEDMAEGPPLVELQEIDTAFQLTEHLKALHYTHTHPADSNQIRAIDADLAHMLTKAPPNTSREIWLYELGRFLIQKTNTIIVALFADKPPCSPQTCPEMRASEWQYLCAVHDPPKSCSAIDYCCHTLDWAASSLTSSKMFPSRLGLGSGNISGGNDKFLQQQIKEITNIFRRVYRIYAHAWFQHREIFWEVEDRTGLYILFKTVCDEYNLIQPENYTIPPEAEGFKSSEVQNQEQEQYSRPRPISLLPRPTESQPEKLADQDIAGGDNKAPGNTAKRHVRGHSNMSDSVTTVIEEEVEEEEEEDTRQQPQALSRSPTVVHGKRDKPEGPDDQELADAESTLPVGTNSGTVKPEVETESIASGDVTVITTRELDTTFDDSHIPVTVETITPTAASAVTLPETPSKDVEG